VLKTSLRRSCSRLHADALRIAFTVAGCNLANAIIAYLFVYESKDLSLESINLMFNDPNCKAWHSTKWCPPGVASRNELSKEADSEKEAARTSWNSPTPVDNENQEDLRSGINHKFAENHNKLATQDV